MHDAIRHLFSVKQDKETGRWFARHKTLHVLAAGDTEEEALCRALSVLNARAEAGACGARAYNCVCALPLDHDDAHDCGAGCPNHIAKWTA